MNNCEITGGSNSSSDIEENQATIALSEATTASGDSTTPSALTPTTTTKEFFYRSINNNNNNNKSNENLEIDTKCAGKTSETPAAAAATAAIAVTASSIVAASSLLPRTAAATTTTVSYAAITAMDTASATAFVCSQKQTEAIPSSECDKNSTTICDKNSTKLQEAEPVTNSASATAAKGAEKMPDLDCLEVLSGEGSKDSGISISNSNSNQNHHEGVKETQEFSVLSSPALSSSPLLLIENKESKEKAPVAVSISTMSPPSPQLSSTVLLSSSSLANTLSGSKAGTNNCVDIVTNSTTKPSPTLSVVSVADNNSMLIAQNKIDNNHLHHHHHPPHPHPLTTTASAPILMQSSDFSRSDAKISTGLGGATTTMGLNAGAMITRRVSFPKSDEALVTGYLEPANPWEHVCMVKSISEIAELYVQSCNKHNTTPIPSVLEHLKLIELDKSMRQPSLLLKNIKLTPADCEALEEIFKRVQYKSIDVSSCELNEAAASALFDMFEYYEVTNELDISSNSDGMTSRGWTSCIFMVSHSRALQVLNAQGNPLSKNCADSLGSALNSSNLHTIKLEHCGLRGHPLDSLCTKLRNNQILKELWLAYNDLTCMDADKIAQLLKTNHFLQLIDISNNNIKDEGLMKIVKALIEQSTELERQKIAAAAIAYAIAEAEHKKRQQLASSNSSNSCSGSNNKNGTNTNNTTSSQTTTTSGSNGMGTSTDDEMTSGDSDASPAEEDDDDDDDDDEADDADVDTDANDAEDDDGTTTEDDGGGSRVEDDDDDEDTVKTSTIKTTPPLNGQSKLDKLLSMNNSDSSEEAPTDTVAASDISVSDDIFDSTNAVPPPLVSSTPITEQTLDQPVSNNNNNTAAAVLFEVHDLIDDADLAKGAIPTKALDVNKNSTKVDDFDDTHSTDSAFESSSDGDISRHLPDEFVDRFDGKDEVETAIIATEALTTPTPTPPPPPSPTPMEMAPPPPPPPTTTITTPKPIEVTPLRQLAASVSPNTSCESSSGGDISALKNAALTGTSPSPAPGMRRTESTCTITQSTRVRSHSSDSLSSDNSLDGSISDTASGNFSTRINEKLTKNDTLTRQKQFDVPVDSNKIPHGLKALALWNNNLTKESGPLIADLLATTVSLELLNIGKNILSNDFVAAIRDSLSKNTTLTTLGLQSAHLSCAGIRTLSSILQFGGNSTLHRIDIRDNKIEVESLNMLAEALKSNTTVTQIDIDDEPKRLSIGSDAQLDYARVLENVRSLCARNENQPAAAAATATDKSSAVLAGKRHGGYYLGSRKISLTCHSAPPRSAIVDQTSSSSSSSSSATTNSTPTSSKLEVKKKTGVRLRSPIPSPPTISPSSSPVPSPSKSRFQVFRVSEVSPLTSPMTPSPSPSPTPSPTPLSTASGVIINSKDSTTTIKRLSTSPRSRFQVMKIYEDPGVPIAHRTLPPITPSPSPPTAPSITRPPLTPIQTPTPPTSLSNSTTPESATTSTTMSSPSWTFEEQKIITTPATPPIQDNATEEPSFNNDTSATTAATTATATATETTTETATATTTTTPITNISATNTKSNPNSIDVNNSTNNTVKPNDQVDALARVESSTPPVQVPPHPEEDELTKFQKHLCPPPLPIVEDDQRTLTNSPDVNINSIGVTTTSCSSAQSELTITTATETEIENETEIETEIETETDTDTATQSTNDPQVLNVSQDLQSQPAAPAASPASGRTRKNSWIPNSTYPGTVDRLLSMFQNPTHLFHRSSSPDTTIPISQEDRGTPPPSEEDLQQSLVPVRRRTPPAANQFPWCKLGTEMCKPVTTVMQSAAAVSSGYVACGPPTTAVVASVESPRSFFDAASKQLRDFSKQVFRQNIAFGNEATNVNQEQQQLTQQQMLQHDCDTIPSDMKLEIKENISPEHTINEEQLHTLQKIGGSPGSSSTSSSGTETTEGASIPSSSSSPSSLLSVPLIGIPPTISPLPPSTETTVAVGAAATTAAVGGSTISPSPPTSSQPQHHVLNEEQSCNS